MHLRTNLHKNMYHMARFVSLHDPPKISVLVSYWFRTVRTGHGPAGDNHPSAVLKSFILFFRAGFVLFVLASAVSVLAGAAREIFACEKCFVLASRTGCSMKRKALV